MEASVLEIYVYIGTASLCLKNTMIFSKNQLGILHKITALFFSKRENSRLADKNPLTTDALL